VIDPVTLIVLILATARLTRLAVWDKITLPIRKAIISGITIKKKQIWKGSGVGGTLSYLAHCVFCAGFWAAVLVAIPFTIWPSNKWLFACYLILAVAEVAPRLLNWEPRTTGGE
jgi:uncharacterized protein DUF1360